MIQWGPEPKNGAKQEVWIWEVKHGGGKAEDDGKDQVDNYIEYLQKQLGNAYIVRPGYVLDPRHRPNRSNPRELITVESKIEEGGVELYDYGSTDPYSVQLRGLRNQSFSKDEKEPRSTPTLDPTTTGKAAGDILTVLGLAGYVIWKGTAWGIAQN
ncbi:hypothetical protein EV649_7339 [Kribbella sp. VKM Ac-2569]|uniref:hypothetical protein n=1 Tax=Kribbella sp. VKM Ac-2569 TaxID=2512220 RepID=UPI00102CF238|nr:hypothetical protein [Kribbella sp. VKM Ac-2569]RZT11689.1 hypothetical protein EV649_7339 [Kribbella sp. VKM Ac-2569]